MKLKFCVLCGVVSCALVLLGCGGSANPNKVSAQKDKLFQAADPTTKANWDAAMAAMKTNGYVVATLSLQEIIRGTNTAATPEQVQAASDTATAVSDSMYSAANKGDAKAQEAINELRKLMGR